MENERIITNMAVNVWEDLLSVFEATIDIQSHPGQGPFAIFQPMVTAPVET